MKMSNKEICNWYIRTFHPNLFCRQKLNFKPFSIEGKQRIGNIKTQVPYRIFDEMMCWCLQSEGYEYWLCESLKLTYLCCIINKNADAYNYLQDLFERARNRTYHNKEVEKIIKRIQKINI